MDIMSLIVSILSGLAAAIPLVVALVKYVQSAAKERNWKQLVDMVINLIEQAETKFEDSDGAEKKEWVLVMLKASADNINFDLDMDAIGNMIDSFCSMTKKVNTPAAEVTEV